MVTLTVNSNYETVPSGNGFLGTAYDALFSSFDAAYGSGIENGVSSSSNVFDEALSGIDMSGKGNSSTAPRAFLNYIFFNQEMNYVRAGFLQITTAAQGVGVHQTISLNDIIADRKGYLLAYLSNENAEEVAIHWDDFMVYHGKTNVVFASSYYPGGLTFNEHQRTASVENKWKFQSKEWLPELRVYDFGPRGWDPLIWRTNAQDILANNFPDQSSYSLFRNNPILFIDPNGAFPIAFFFRSFHTASKFGFPFTAVGDNRTASTSLSASARVHHLVGFETSNSSVTGVQTFSSQSTQLNYPFSPFGFSKQATESPTSYTGPSGDGFFFGYSGQEPIMKKIPLIGKALTPAIDLGGNIKISESAVPCLGCAEGETSGLKEININGQISGDHFPDAESFIMDVTGQTILLGQSAHLSPGRPALNLLGNKDAPMMKFNAQIIVDQNGKFINAYTTDSDGNITNMTINAPQEGYQKVLEDLKLK
ncbi:MAG: hypothetical protein AAF620_14915 [Bacteroidota bacterium]